MNNEDSGWLLLCCASILDGQIIPACSADLRLSTPAASRDNLGNLPLTSFVRPTRRSCDKHTLNFMILQQERGAPPAYCQRARRRETVGRSCSTQHQLTKRETWRTATSLCVPGVQTWTQAESSQSENSDRLILSTKTGLLLRLLLRLLLPVKCTIIGHIHKTNPL